MKIEGGRGVAPGAGARRAAGAAAPGFAPAMDAPQRAAVASGVQAIASLDAIIALQADGDGQKRARQARRGRDALDALDQLARGLVLGHAPAGLRAELEGLRHGAEPSGDAGLDAILQEIDIRVAVELAKLDMAAGRP